MKYRFEFVISMIKIPLLVMGIENRDLDQLFYARSE